MNRKVRQAASVTVESLETRRLFAGYAAEPLYTIEDATPEAGAGFGTSIASHGNLLLIGNSMDDGITGAVANAGVVRLYDTSGSTPQLIRQIEAPLPTAGAGFGAQVAFVDADTFAVSSVEADGSGKVYVYDGVSDTAPGVISAGSQTGFGRRLLGYNNDLIITANSGYVALHDLAVPETGGITSSPTFADPNGFLGESLAISGDRLFVGANHDDDFSTGYVAEFNLANPSAGVIGRYESPDANEFSFGLSIAANDTHLFVTSFGTGQVYEFAIGGSATGSYVGPAGSVSFASRVVVDGDTLLIGADQEAADGTTQGAVYSVAINNDPDDNGNYSRLANPTPTTSEFEPEFFGFNFVTLASGNLVVLDAGHDDGGQEDAGIIYVFAPAPDEPEEPAVATAEVVGGNLVVTGTAASEVIDILSAGTAGVHVYVAGEHLGTFAPTGRIIVYGGDGNDAITVGTDVAFDADLNGEAGNDTLTAGGGSDFLSGGDGNDQLTSRNASDILLGGAGDDVLLGGNSRDLLIGGDGADQIAGDNGDDILVAGFTSHDGDRAALSAILAVWNNGQSRDSRIANLQATYFATGNVHSDNMMDSLFGGNGQDYFLVDVDGEALDVTKQEA